MVIGNAVLRHIGQRMPNLCPIICWEAFTMLHGTSALERLHDNNLRAISQLLDCLMRSRALGRKVVEQHRNLLLSLPKAGFSFTLCFLITCTRGLIGCALSQVYFNAGMFVCMMEPETSAGALIHALLQHIDSTCSWKMSCGTKWSSHLGRLSCLSACCVASMLSATLMWCSFTCFRSAAQIKLRNIAPGAH